MKHLSALLFLFLFLFTACEEVDLQPSFNVANPTQNLAWLKEKVKELEVSSYCQTVQRGVFRDRTVFVIYNCDPAVLAIPVVYDCDGNLICYGGDDSCPNFIKEVKGLAPVWRNGI